MPVTDIIFDPVSDMRVALANGGPVYAAVSQADALLVSLSGIVPPVNPVSPSLSTFTADPTTLCGGGITVSNLTVQLLDTAGQPVANKTVTITADIPGLIIAPASAVTDASGIALFTATLGTVTDPEIEVILTAEDTTDSIVLDQQAGISAEATDFVLEIAGGTDIDIFTEVVDAGYDPDCLINLTVNITDPVTSLTLGDFTDNGINITIVNQSFIYGLGGAGANASFGTGSVDGGDGGAAFELSGFAVSIDNTAGFIFGGGGGGGAGGYVEAQIETDGPGNGNPAYLSSGGGGGGGASGTSVIGGNPQTSSSMDGHYSMGTIIDGIFHQDPVYDAIGTSTFATGISDVTSVVTAGTGGDDTGFGAGGDTGTADLSNGSFAGTGTAGAGGDGGDWGEPGESGNDGELTGDQLPGTGFGLGSSGGAAGNAITLNGGTVNWLGGNNPAQVKGAVA